MSYIGPTGDGKPCPYCGRPWERQRSANYGDVQYRLLFGDLWNGEDFIIDRCADGTWTSRVILKS